jgi:hypothetical protein
MEYHSRFIDTTEFALNLLVTMPGSGTSIETAVYGPSSRLEGRGEKW